MQGRWVAFKSNMVDILGRGITAVISHVFQQRNSKQCRTKDQDPFIQRSLSKINQHIPLFTLGEK